MRRIHEASAAQAVARICSRCQCQMRGITWRFGSVVESMDAGGGRLVHPPRHEGDRNA